MADTTREGNNFEPTPSAPAPARGPNRDRVYIAVGLVLLVFAAAVIFVSQRDGGSDVVAVSSGEIFLQPAAAIGIDPFIDEPGVVDEVDVGLVVGIRPTPPTAPAAAGQPVATVTVVGTEPGLYGGTRDDSACNVEAQITFLEANPEKAAAWADAQGVDKDRIGEFLRGLTPALLLSDTRVTNHGFRDLRANPFQSVLEAGTAVLVDDNGVPRARCACGNPLAAPIAQPSGTTFSGDSWDGFSPDDVTVVVPGQPIGEFVLVDITDGDPFIRANGTTGADDTPAPPGALEDRSRVAPLAPGTATTVPTTAPPTVAPATAAATTAPPTTVAPTTSTAAPTTTAAPVTNITASGRVSASSVFDPSFSAALGVDGSASTSWFSAGPSGGGTTFTWTAPSDVFVDRITIVGNGGHANQQFRTGFGFGSVRVEFLDTTGRVVTTATADLGGTPDPTVEIALGATARTIRLQFSGSEDPSCGGFAEFIVTGRT